MKGRKNCVLDRAMPTWSSNEYHHTYVDAPSRNVVAAVEQLTWREVPWFHRTIRTVGMGAKIFRADDRVLDLLLDGPYALVHRSDEEVVIGGVLPLNRHQRLPDLGSRPLESFSDYMTDGVVKVAINFLVRDGVLSTETRNLPLGRRASSLFAVY